MAARNIIDEYRALMQDINQGKIAPVYCLMGDEPYFTQQIAKLLEQKVVSDEARDFDQTVLYGADIDSAGTILDAAVRYPMMSERGLVIVREAQSIKVDLDALVPYIQQPSSQTVLVLCYMGATIDRRRKLATALARNGVVFEGVKLWDSQLPPFVNGYVKSLGCSIDRAACEMLCSCVGSDLTRLVAEIEKLRLALPQGQEQISEFLVQEQVGQSKEYKAFELVNALAEHDALKANRIVFYFGGNPKGLALPMINATLFSFFSNLLLSYYSPDKSESGVAAFLSVSPVYVRRSIMPAKRFYSGRKVLQIIRYIRRIDAKSKGVDCSSTSDFELLCDLIYFILH